MNPVIELRQVHVVHRARTGKLLDPDRVRALTAADFAVRRGETVGVVGESGCGKSTLVKVLAGLQQPTSGSVLFRGAELWARRSPDRKVFGASTAVIFQDPSTALNPRMTVGQILRDPLAVHRRQDAAFRRTRVAELLDLVGLAASAGELLPSQLSGGQRQRVAIARALALEPDVIIADEPTSALDVSVRAQVLTLLAELKTRLGMGLVFISHDIQTVGHVADRIAVMYLGRVVETGPTSILTSNPRHPYTRALFSASPRLLGHQDKIVLHGTVPSATHPPLGCPFRTRCWRAQDACASGFPDRVVGADPEHQYHCVHPLEYPFHPEQESS